MKLSRETKIELQEEMIRANSNMQNHESALVSALCAKMCSPKEDEKMYNDLLDKHTELRDYYQRKGEAIRAVLFGYDD